MARITMIQGLPAFLCPGCNVLHRVDTRFIYNYKPEAPTFRPEIRLTVSGFPAGHPMEGKTVQCYSRVREGKITFLPETTHSLKDQAVDLPDFDKLKAASEAMKHLATKPQRPKTD